MLAVIVARRTSTARTGGASRLPEQADLVDWLEVAALAHLFARLRVEPA